MDNMNLYMHTVPESPQFCRVRSHNFTSWHGGRSKLLSL